MSLNGRLRTITNHKQSISSSLQRYRAAINFQVSSLRFSNFVMSVTGSCQEDVQFDWPLSAALFLFVDLSGRMFLSAFSFSRGLLLCVFVSLSPFPGEGKKPNHFKSSKISLRILHHRKALAIRKHSLENALEWYTYISLDVSLYVL